MKGVSSLCLHEENGRGGAEASVKITCDLEEMRSCLKRRLHGHNGMKIDLKEQNE